MAAGRGGRYDEPMPSTLARPTPELALRYRWAILTVAFLAHVVGAAGQFSIQALAPVYQPDLGLTRSQVGLFVAAFYLGMAGISLPAGWLIDLLGGRRILIAAHLVVGLACLLAARLASFQQGLAIFLLEGVAYSFINPVTTVGILRWHPVWERATAMGFKQTGVPVGGVIAATLAVPLALAYSWRTAFAAVGMGNLVLGVLFGLLWGDPPRQGSGVPVRQGVSLRGVRAVLRDRALLALSVAIALYLIGQMSILTYIALYLKEALGYSVLLASASIAAAQIGGSVGRIGWGVVSDRLFGGRRRIVLITIGTASALSAVLLALLPRSSPHLLVYLIAGLAGVCMVGYQGVYYTYVGELVRPELAGVAIGFSLSITAVAVLVGPPLFGWVVDRTGSYPLAWALLAGTLATGVLLLSRVDEPGKRR